MAEPIHAQALEILHTWKTDAKINKNIHNAAANYYSLLNKCITIPLLAIMAASGTTLLSSLSSDPNDNKITIVFDSQDAIKLFQNYAKIYTDLNLIEFLYNKMSQHSDDLEVFNFLRTAITQKKTPVVAAKLIEAYQRQDINENLT